MEPKALAGSMSVTPLTEMVVSTGAGSAGLVCDEVFALAAVFLACDCCGGRAAKSMPLSAANIKTVAKPGKSRRIKDSSESRELGEIKARVSQLAPVLGDGRTLRGEASMKLGCQADMERMESVHGAYGGWVGNGKVIGRGKQRRSAGDPD